MAPTPPTDSGDLSREARIRALRAEELTEAARPSTRVGRVVAGGWSLVRASLIGLGRVTGRRDASRGSADVLLQAEANVLQMLGSALRNEDLLRQGRGKRAAASALDKARHLRAVR
jgi:hypothetical protein